MIIFVMNHVLIIFTKIQIIYIIVLMIKVAKLFIIYFFQKKIDRCIDDCKKDNIYKYQYNNNCFINCPYNTIFSDNSFICELIIPKNYSSNVIIREVDILIDEFNSKLLTCDSNYIIKKKNDTICIYKRNECPDPNLPNIDLCDFYKKNKRI